MTARAIEYLERPPPGWFVLEIMRTTVRSRDWVALMVDFDPDDPLEDYRAGRRRTRSCWVRIAGKHRSRDAAWEALESMTATRH